MLDMLKQMGHMATMGMFESDEPNYTRKGYSMNLLERQLLKQVEDLTKEAISERTELAYLLIDFMELYVKGDTEKLKLHLEKCKYFFKLYLKDTPEKYENILRKLGE